MRPRLPAMLLAPGGLGLRFAPSGYRRFFGFRSLLAVSSVACSRIEFVSRGQTFPQLYGLSVHFQLLSTPCHHGAVTFGCWWEAPPGRDFHPPCARCLPSARVRRFSAAMEWVPKQSQPAAWRRWHSLPAIQSAGKPAHSRCWRVFGSTALEHTPLAQRTIPKLHIWGARWTIAALNGFSHAGCVKGQFMKRFH